MLGIRVGMLALGAAIAAGCGDSGPAPTPDAGMDAGPPVDAGSDAGLLPSELFGPCVEDSQCPGDGATCWRGADGYPEGYCTVPCMDRGPCDDGVVFNHCLVRMGETVGHCERRCLNGVDCMRAGYTCIGNGTFDATDTGVCYGVCGGDIACGAGSECNPWSGRCITEGDVPVDGSLNGGTCAVDTDCRSGNCIEERRGSTPTGWNSGYCYGFCILPMGYNTNTLFSEDTLPQGTCAENDICFPNGSYTRGDLGICFQGCITNDDCRVDEGYVCRSSWRLASGDTRTFTNGICVPMTCSATSPCPTGFTCRTVTTTSGTSYVCARL